MPENTSTTKFGPLRKAITFASLTVIGSVALVSPADASAVTTGGSRAAASAVYGAANSTPSEARADRKEPSSRGLPRAGGPAASQRFARAYIAQRYGWGAGQFSCLRIMWTKESAWKYWVSNPNGKYHGIPQTSWREWTKSGYTASQYMNSPEIQIRVGARYIKSRYGSPCAAWSFWQRHHWY